MCPRDELSLAARIRYSEMTEISPPSFSNSGVWSFDSITGWDGHWSTAQEKQNHPEQQFSNKGLGVQINIWIATRPHTLSTLLWPWRAIGKTYTETDNPLKCFFQCKFKCLCQQSPLQRGQSHSPHPTAAWQGLHHWMPQDCLSTLLWVLLQNLSDTSSDPSPFLQQPEHTPMPATGTCKVNYQTMPWRAWLLDFAPALSPLIPPCSHCFPSGQSCWHNGYWWQRPWPWTTLTEVLHFQSKCWLLQSTSEKESRTVWVTRGWLYVPFRGTQEMGDSITHLKHSACCLAPTSHLAYPHPQQIYEVLPPWKVHFPRTIWLLSLQLLILHG